MSDQGPGPDDEIIEGEIVDDDIAPTVSEPPPLIPADVVLSPCHHGCTCGLHMQVVYGERVPMHGPEVLDHGEMGLLTEAAERAERRANEYHTYLSQLREVVQQTYGKATKALDELEVLLHSRVAGRAGRHQVELERAELTPEQREPAPRWLVGAAVVAAVCVAVFDAYFFQQTFLNILQISAGAPPWEHDIGLMAAGVFAIGLIASGRMLCGPIWRLAQSWRRKASPDDRPPGRRAVAVRAALIVAPPAAILFVLGWWASLRGQMAVLSAAAAVGGGSAAPVVPSALPVMLLLLSLALTVIVLEVLVYNPYKTALKRDSRELKKLLKCGDKATDALTVHQIAWRDLRSSQDEVIGFVRAELARPWHTVILPARLRHGRAGPEPVAPEYGADVKVTPVPAIGPGRPGTGQVQITYQIFEGVAQPQPSPGPLAETVRSVLDLRPEELAGRHEELRTRLLTELGRQPEWRPDSDSVPA